MNIKCDGCNEIFTKENPIKYTLSRANCSELLDSYFHKPECIHKWYIKLQKLKLEIQ